MKIIFAYLLFIFLPFVSSHRNMLHSNVNEAILRSVTPMTILASVINCNWILRKFIFLTEEIGGGGMFWSLGQHWSGLANLIGIPISAIHEWICNYSYNCVSDFSLEITVIDFHTWHHLFCITIGKSSGIRSRDQGDRVYE